MSTLLKTQKNQTIFLLSVFAILFCLRRPDIWIGGRFWAEEGTYFYHNALVQPPSEALTYVFGGYLNLAANFFTLLSTWIVPIDYAPYVTIFAGLLFALLPFFLLFTAQDAWLQNFRTKLIITFLFLLVPASSEISLQSLHIQFYLALSCAIIAALETQNNYQRWFRLAVLFFAPLCGLMVIPLIAVFGLRFIVERKWLRFEQTLFLAIGSAVQIFFFYQHISGSTRHYGFSVVDFLSVCFARDLLIPFLGMNRLSIHFIHGLHQALQNHHIPLRTCLIALIAMIPILFWLLRYPKTRPAFWFLLSALLLRAISIYGGIGGALDMIDPYSSERYIFCSQALFCLALVYFAVSLTGLNKKIVDFLILWLIFVGMFNYLFPFPATAHGPSWHKEISIWKNDHNYKPKCWPDSWAVEIPNK